MNYFSTRSSFKHLAHQLRRLRNSTPSMEQAIALLELTGAYAGVSVESPAISMESGSGIDQVLDKAENNISRVQATLEWFFSKAKEQKVETTTAYKGPTEEEKFKHLKDKYGNKGWMAKATLHVKPTILTGSVGGVLSEHGKALSVDETIRKLEDSVKKIRGFKKDAEQTYTKWIKWGVEITEAVTREWEEHKNEESIPSITKVVSSLYQKQPPRPSKKYKLESYLTLGVPADYAIDNFESTLAVKDAHVEFEPLTSDQVMRLAAVAIDLHALYEELFDLTEALMDHMGHAGFDDYPYRADQVQDAIAAFGWKKADWDAHSTFDELSFIDVLVDGAFKQFGAIHAWLYNAVVERP